MYVHIRTHVRMRMRACIHVCMLQDSICYTTANTYNTFCADT